MRLGPQPLLDGVAQPLLDRVDVVVVDDQVSAQVLDLAPVARREGDDRGTKGLEGFYSLTFFAFMTLL